MTEPLRFLGLAAHEADPATAAATIVPVPYDGTSTWMKGAHRGPRAILEASQHVELYDLESATEPFRHGIATGADVPVEGSPEQLVERVERRVGAVLDGGSLPVVLGGEHSVSIGAIRAAAARNPGLSVLQIDAHGDTRDEYEGSRFNHACVMARAREHADIVQVGIRAVDAAEMPSMAADRVFWAHQIVPRSDRGWVDSVVQKLTPSVYVTIDLDAFDPSLVPATGTPEPGGLDWYQVTDLLAAVAAQRRVVGFDVVELLPREGEHASAFLAAKLVHRFLAMILARRGGAVGQPGAPR